MANMSYCRFENTLLDLQDCSRFLRDQLDSDYEIKARKDLIQLCKDIAEEMGDEDNYDPCEGCNCDGCDDCE